MVSPALLSSAKEDWGTPPSFFARARERFGLTGRPFVDAAASAQNALSPIFWTKEDNALAQDWRVTTRMGFWHFANPPYDKYGTQRKFVTKGPGAEALFLIAARTDTRMFHVCFHHAEEIVFIEGRLTFVDPVKTNPAPFPSMLVYFNPRCAGPARISTMKARG